MYNGLFPFDEPNSIDIDMLSMDKESFEFWHPLNDYHRYKNTTIWYYKTIESHRRNGIQKCISLPLMYIAPDLVYKQSKRPKTSMDIFRSPSSIVVDRSSIIKLPGEEFLYSVTISGETFNAIPVSRYGAGMSKGLYHDEYEDDPLFTLVNGTFYYYEPESSTFLTFKEHKTYFNKTEAAIQLNDEFSEFGGFFTRDYRDIGNKSLIMHMDGTLPKDLKLTPRQLVDIYGITPAQYHSVKNKKDVIGPEIPHYIGLNRSSKIYGYEDELDRRSAVDTSFGCIS
jgi:hypothetical protein